MTQRKIIHIDADCFYAAIEVRDDPSLRGKPVAVGGPSDSRGVISTCNYEARAYGVHSAMPSATAMRLCPDLIMVRGRFDAYRTASAQMREIFNDYTALVEPLSLDEAYLDVSECEQCKGSATLIAAEIRQRIASKLGITVSAGIAPNKFIAKVASDWQKPDGQTVITPAEVDDFVKALPVKKIFGVGKVTAEKLSNFGVVTCGELRHKTIFELIDKFGTFGKRLYDLCRGIDEREVKPSRRRKSLSVENTYSKDIVNAAHCREKIDLLSKELDRRLRKVDADYLATKSFVKIKFADFSQTTIERHLETDRIKQFMELFNEGYERQNKPVRLLGVGVRFMDLHEKFHPDQLDMFDELEKQDQLKKEALKKDTPHSSPHTLPDESTQ